MYASSVLPRLILGYWSLDYSLFCADLKCTFKLPPYLYAICLIDQFATYIGHDWHWFRVRRFRQRLEATYKIPNSAESRDRLWLCQLLVVYALSEAFNGEAGSIEVSTHISPNPDQQFSSDGDTTASSPSGACQNPPGMDFFEQALQLLKVPYEEITVEHIEVLNLIVSPNPPPKHLSP